MIRLANAAQPFKRNHFVDCPRVLGTLRAFAVKVMKKFGPSRRRGFQALAKSGRLFGFVGLEDLFLLIVCATLPSASCVSSVPGRADDGGKDISLLERLELETGDSGGALHRNMRVGRGGRWEVSSVLVAPAAARADISGLGGPVRLDLHAASVFNIGDGFRLDLFVCQSPAKRAVYSYFFDPGRTAKDRDWIAFTIPLDLPSTGKVWLELRVSAGPQEDLVGDWLAISRMRLVRAAQ